MHGWFVTPTSYATPSKTWRCRPRALQCALVLFLTVFVFACPTRAEESEYVQMDTTQNDVSASSPDGNEPSGSDSTPPTGDQNSRPDSSSEAASSLSTPAFHTAALDAESAASDKPAGMPRRNFVQGLVASGAALVAGAMLAGGATPASASIATARPGSPNPWEASQGIYSGVSISPPAMSPSRSRSPRGQARAAD